MGSRDRPVDYPKLENYEPTKFMLPTSHYDEAKADRAVRFIENLKHTKGKWDGKHRLIAVNHVHAENQRNAQAALLDGNFLQRADVGHAFHVEQATHLSFFNLSHHVTAH